jgi:hypothetical protein
MNALAFVCSMCERAFGTARGLQTHQAYCARRFPTPDSGETDVTMDASDALPDEANLRRRNQLFVDNQRATYVKDLASLRYDLFTPASHVDRVKDMVKNWVSCFYSSWSYSSSSYYYYLHYRCAVCGMK